MFRRFLGPRATTLSVSPPLWGPRPARRMWPLLIIHPPCCWLAARAQAFYIYSDFRPFFAESRTGVYPGNGPDATLLEAHAVLIIGEAGLVLFCVRAPFGYLRTRCPLLRTCPLYLPKLVACRVRQHQAVLDMPQQLGEGVCRQWLLQSEGPVTCNTPPGPRAAACMHITVMRAATTCTCGFGCTHALRA